jgi:hypothetical protein
MDIIASKKSIYRWIPFAQIKLKACSVARHFVARLGPFRACLLPKCPWARRAYRSNLKKVNQ